MLEIRQRKNLIAVQEFGAELLNNFFDYLDVSEKTRLTYRKALKQVFQYFTENGISRPCHDDILSFKKSLENKGRKPSTIALYLAATRRFFSWTQQRGIYQNIAVGVKAPRQDKGHKKDFFSAKQLKGILSSMNRDSLMAKRDFAIMAVLSACGLRTIEINRANVADMRVMAGEPLLFVQGKGRNEKTEFVKLPEPVYQAISDYLSKRGDAKDTEPLFAGVGNRNHGGRMATRTISMIAKKTMRNAGFDSARLTAHSLRHTAVTLSLMAGNSLSETQAFARHSNINTTEIYSHVVDRLKSKCESSIANMIF